MVCAYLNRFTHFFFSNSLNVVKHDVKKYVDESHMDAFLVSRDQKICHLLLAGLVYG
jgi:hypothetical protein